LTPVLAPPAAADIRPLHPRQETAASPAGQTLSGAPENGSDGAEASPAKPAVALPPAPQLRPESKPARPQRFPVAAPPSRVAALTEKTTPGGQATASAPEVTITIGRVEIRAVAPAAPVPHAAVPAPGPHLSLDAYLRRSASQPA
jgi:hypothetical protein